MSIQIISTTSTNQPEEITLQGLQESEAMLHDSLLSMGSTQTDWDRLNLEITLSPDIHIEEL